MRRTTEKSLAYFFRTNRRQRREVHDAVTRLQAFGPVVVIGGMIRDLALAGNREFGSDIDFVVKPRNVAEFQSFMTLQRAKMNRFGGYAWNGMSWKMDVWPLQKTWAHQEGHVEVRVFSDLLKTTFFDCDAIIYNLQSKRLVAKSGYFGRLACRELEINLLENPNPAGNAVRALRYAAIRNFGWGPKLCEFMSKKIEELGWRELQDTEARSFRTYYIAQMNHRKIARKLDVHLRSRNQCAFRLGEFLGNEQKEFQFNLERR